MYSQIKLKQFVSECRSNIRKIQTDTNFFYKLYEHLVIYKFLYEEFAKIFSLIFIGTSDGSWISNNIKRENLISY